MSKGVGDREEAKSSARAQPWALHVMMEIYQLRVVVGFVDLFVRTPLPSIKLIETETKIQESILRVYMYIYHVTDHEMKLFFVKTVFRGFEFQSYNLKVNIQAFLIVLIRWNRTCYRVQHLFYHSCSGSNN